MVRGRWNVTGNGLTSFLLLSDSNGFRQAAGRGEPGLPGGFEAVVAFIGRAQSKAVPRAGTLLGIYLTS